jgi:NADPH-dependent glutamate synthase beta subunit-like oxidoreductase
MKSSGKAVLAVDLGGTSVKILATRQVQAAATVTASCDDEGFAKVVEQFIAGPEAS